MTDTGTDASKSAGTATQRLRSGTRAWHEALERTGFATAMLAGTLPLDRYVGQLAAYRAVLSVLEAELARATCPSVASVWSPDLVKLPLVERDLHHFAATRGVLPEPGPAAEEFAEEIRRTAATEPRELLGFLYVLEGSTLGAMFLCRYVTEAYRLRDGNGASYYGSGDRTRWAALTERLDRVLGEPVVQEQVLAAAERAYRHIALISGELSAGLGVPAPEHV
ncbi:biliverdin-producing heme oxygenase [Streptomyces sp. NBC_01288]|uniref:biliverdin-producing heme oxygenase n=1 Tax=Streptomyces sp. NBC_01288 TaxID=2903814 RepID=UPI002E14E4F3|nr:biliverdin-producing heme oxygenase [Streptomyces sp. NBC_01288]